MISSHIHSLTVDDINTDDVAVILLNWNSSEDSRSCIESLTSNGIAQKQIFLVDNNSQDNSYAEILECYGQIIGIKSSQNLGFAGGCNIGIKEALVRGYSYIWLLNNDTVIDLKTLPSMIDLINGKDIGIVGSVIKDMKYPHEIQAYGGGNINFFAGKSTHIKSHHERLDYITGCSMLIRAEVFDDTGLLDDKMFMYWEDADFSLRSIKLGWRLVVADQSIVYHKESSSVGKNSKNQIRLFNDSGRIFFKKHTKLYLVPILVGQIGRSVKTAMRGQISLIKYIWNQNADR